MESLDGLIVLSPGCSRLLPRIFDNQDYRLFGFALSPRWVQALPYSDNSHEEVGALVDTGLLLVLIEDGGVLCWYREGILRLRKDLNAVDGDGHAAFVSFVSAIHGGHRGR
jgi:hypothetical protein